jgi:hypothetical protein
MQQMLDQNIVLGYHYAAIYLFSRYRKRGFKDGMSPVAEQVCRQIINIAPLSRHERIRRRKRVVTAVAEIFDRLR